MPDLALTRSEFVHLNVCGSFGCFDHTFNGVSPAGGTFSLQVAAITPSSTLLDSCFCEVHYFGPRPTWQLVLK